MGLVSGTASRYKVDDSASNSSLNDVFISYARPDRETAHRVADALEACGLSVWWDHDLAPGQKFAAVIAQELGRARCVLVLWSKASVASAWVSDEAAEGLQRGVLVPAVIDAGVLPPLGFRGLHTADLSAWLAGGNDDELQRLCRAVEALAGVTPAPAPTPRPPQPPPPSPPLPPSPPPPTPPTPRPAPPEPSKLKRNIGIGVLAVCAMAAYQAWEQAAGDSGGGLNEVAAPLQMPVTWQDDVLRYEGRIAWDGQSGGAELMANLVDMPSGRPLGSYRVPAQATRFGPRQVEFNASFELPWDTKTPHPHSHSVQLRFEHGPNGWVFVRR